MPKNTVPQSTVNDPITGQEIAFAHLVLSGTMNDRQAAEAAGLNPDDAADTKSKPRVRDYMIEHSKAVKQKLIDQESGKLNLGRGQVLTRLWELANLSHEVTRGSIAGQIKALSMIVAIEGLIPDGRVSPSKTQPADPPIKAEIYTAEWLREQQSRAAGEGPRDNVAPEAQPVANPVPPTEHAPQPTPTLEPNQPSPANPSIEARMRVPDAMGGLSDPALDPSRLPFYMRRGRFGNRR
jgi:hypothetical protein